MRDAYKEVTNRIVAHLEQGVKPWQKPWKSTALAAPMLPANLASGRYYNGVNTLMLWLETIERGYPTHTWATFAQVQQLGGHVRKGEKGSHVVFAKPTQVDKDGQITTFPTFRWYSVFNAAQIEGIELPDYGPPDVPEMAVMVGILDNSGVPVQHGCPRACYIPSLDRIEMPAFGAFQDGESYARVLFHELAHATGHKKRLNRDMSGRFGDASYAMEELVAEMTSAFLCARIGSHYANENAEYIGVWIKKLKEDSRAIFTAASMAAKAADWLYDRSLAKEPEKELENSY